MTLERRLALLQPPTGHVDMILDTDAYNETDDQFAISLALRSKEKMTVKGFCAAPFLNERSESAGDGMEKSYNEIKKLLKLAGEESVPVYRGSEIFLPDEKTPVDSESARFLCDLAMNYDDTNPLYVVAIGAITNVASALLMKPEIAERIVVVWLGGHALHWPDNREFNCFQDVAAVRIVFNSGCPLVMLPAMGVVSGFAISGDELTAWLKNTNPLADYLAQQAIDAANLYARGKVWTRIIWDVTAIGWLLNEGDRFMKHRLEYTPIPEYDDHWARDCRRPLCTYVYHIERDQLARELFAKLTK